MPELSNKEIVGQYLAGSETLSVKRYAVLRQILRL